MIEIYTDGSTLKNGCKDNTGGYGVVAMIPDPKEQCGYRIDYLFSRRATSTTNNRMEISAILKALDLARTIYRDETCIIKSDSAYCVNMFNSWIRTWASNGWKNSKKVTVENLDLVLELYEYVKIDFPNFEIIKVKGHNEVVGNEIADALATDNSIKLAKIFKENDITVDSENKFDFYEKK